MSKKSGSIDPVSTREKHLLKSLISPIQHLSFDLTDTQLGALYPYKHTDMYFTADHKVDRKNLGNN